MQTQYYLFLKYILQVYLNISPTILKIKLIFRFGLPNLVTDELKKLVPKAVFATNPCRIQYCTREIVVFRANLVTKFLQGSLYKPPREDIGNCVSIFEDILYFKECKF